MAGSIQPLCIEACKEFNLHLHEQYDEGKNVLELCGQRSTYSGTPGVRARVRGCFEWRWIRGRVC